MMPQLCAELGDVIGCNSLASEYQYLQNKQETFTLFYFSTFTYLQGNTKKCKCRKKHIFYFNRSEKLKQNKTNAKRNIYFIFTA